MRAWAARTILFPLFAARDGEPDLPRLVRGQAELARLSAAALEARQLERLRAILAYARDQFPFHAKRFADHGFRPEDLRGIGDLARIPLLTKDDIRAHEREVRTGAADLIRTSTGGSTASPLTFYRDPACHRYRHAGTWEAGRWIGWRPGDPWGLVWGARQDLEAKKTLKGFLRNALLDRERVLDMTGSSRGDMERFLESLRRDPPRFLYGYTNAIYELTRLAASLGRRMPPPRGIVVTAEPLIPEEKAFMQDFWGAPVLNRYACREFGVVAAECRHGCGLHVMTDSVVVEVVKPAGAGDEDPGEVVITDLVNRGMPFIRYPMGDATRWLGPSRCDLPYPVLAPITGRASDLLLSTEGRYVSGTGIIFDVLADRTAITGLQLVQESRGAITANVVPGPGYGAGEKEEIARRVRQFLGASMRLDFVEVREIPKEASGKIRFTINKVPAEWAKGAAPK